MVDQIYYNIYMYIIYFIAGFLGFKGYGKKWIIILWLVIVAGTILMYWWFFLLVLALFGIQAMLLVVSIVFGGNLLGVMVCFVFGRLGRLIRISRRMGIPLLESFKYKPVGDGD